MTDNMESRFELRLKGAGTVGRRRARAGDRLRRHRRYFSYRCMRWPLFPSP